MNALAYCRVSTAEQGNSGAGSEAQKDAIARKCQLEGWQLVQVVEEVASGASLSKRPLLQGVLTSLASGDAEALIVSKVDRLSRSLLDFAALVELSRKQSWRLIVLDLGVDTATPSGEMMANVLATFAQYERRLIGQRTKDALAVKKSQGIRLGRPNSIDSDTRALICELRSEGQSLWAICRELEERGIATSRGGKSWRPSSLEAVLKSGPRPYPRAVENAA